MNVIDSVFNLGDDALGNEYMVTFGNIPFLAGSEPLNLRATTFEIPASSIGTYEVQYKSEKLVKPNGQNMTAKEFSFEFRHDKFYLHYKAFRAWQASIVNPNTGGIAMDSINGMSVMRVPITVTSGYLDLDGNFVPTSQIWQFTGCWPTEVGGLTLDNSSAEPLMCSIRFSYLKQI